MPKDTPRQSQRGAATNRNATASPYARPSETPNQRQEKTWFKETWNTVKNFLAPSFLDRSHREDHTLQDEPEVSGARPTASSSSATDLQRGGTGVRAGHKPGVSNILDESRGECRIISDDSGDSSERISVEVDGYQAIFSTDVLRDDGVRRSVSGTSDVLRDDGARRSMSGTSDVLRDDSVRRNTMSGTSLTSSLYQTGFSADSLRDEGSRLSTMSGTSLASSYQAGFNADSLRDDGLQRPPISGTRPSISGASLKSGLQIPDRPTASKPVGMFEEKLSADATRNSLFSGSTVSRSTRRSSLAEHKSLFFGSNRGELAVSSQESAITLDDETEGERAGERNFLWSNSNNSSISSTSSSQPKARDNKPAFNITAFHETVNKGTLNASLNRTYPGFSSLSKATSGGLPNQSSANQSQLGASTVGRKDDKYKSSFYDGPTAYGGVASAMRSGQKVYPTPYGSRVSVVQRIKPNISKQDPRLGEMAGLSITARKILNALQQHDDTSGIELRPGSSLSESSQMRLRSVVTLRGPTANTPSLYKRNSAGFLNKSFGPPIKPLNISSKAMLVPNFCSTSSKASTVSKPGEPIFGAYPTAGPSLRPAIGEKDSGLQGKGKDILGGGGCKMKRGRTTQHEAAPLFREIEENRDTLGSMESNLANVKPLTGITLQPGSLGIKSTQAKSKPYTFHLPTPVAPLPHSKCTRTFLFSEPKKSLISGVDVSDGLQHDCQVYTVQASYEKSPIPSLLSGSNSSRSPIKSVAKASASDSTIVQSSQPSLSELFKKKSDSWTCDTCLVSNVSTTDKCLACETPKPNSQQGVHASTSLPVAPTSSAAASSNLPSLSEMFKKKADTWTCDTCFITNALDLSKCASCETPKPGVKATSSKPDSQLSGSTALKSSAQTLPDNYKIDSSKPSLAEMFKKNKPAGQWECDTCMVSNRPEAVKCLSCETPKPGAKIASDSGEKSTTVSINVADGGGFTFKGAGSFTSGGFGSFGSSTATSSSASVSIASGGFSFGSGNSALTSSSAPSSGGFSLATTTPGSFSGGFKFGGMSATTTTSTSGGLATSAGGFSTSGFSFGSSCSTPITTSNGSTDDLTRPALRSPNASPVGQTSSNGGTSLISGTSSAKPDLGVGGFAPSASISKSLAPSGDISKAFAPSGETPKGGGSILSSSGVCTGFQSPPINTNTLGSGFKFGSSVTEVPCDNAKAGTSDVVSVSASGANPVGGFVFGLNTSKPQSVLGFGAVEKAKPTDSLPASSGALSGFSFGTGLKSSAGNFGGLTSSVVTTGATVSLGLGTASGFGVSSTSSSNGNSLANGILPSAASNSDAKPSFSFGAPPTSTVAAAPDLTASVGGSNKSFGAAGFGGFSATSPLSSGGLSIAQPNPTLLGSTTTTAPSGMFGFGQPAASTAANSLFQFGKPVDKLALGGNQPTAGPLSFTPASSGLSFAQNSIGAGDTSSASLFKFGEGAVKSVGGENQNKVSAAAPALFTLGTGSKPNLSFNFSGQSTANSTAAPFANSIPPAFGSNSVTFGFGASAVTTSSTFGAGSAPLFAFGASSNAPSAPGFGSTAVTTAAPSVFGSGGFGSTPAPGFFAPSTASTDFGTANSVPSFGSGFGTASTVPSFGTASTASTFGSGFGTAPNSNPSAFGAQSAAAAAAFGGPFNGSSGNALPGASPFGSTQLGGLNSGAPMFGVTNAINNGTAPDMFKLGVANKRSFDACAAAVPAKRTLPSNDSGPQFSFNAPQIPQNNSFSSNGVPNFGTPSAPSGFNFAAAASGSTPSFNFAGSAPGVSAFQFGGADGGSQASAGGASGRVIRKAVRRRPK